MAKQYKPKPINTHVEKPADRKTSMDPRHPMAPSVKKVMKTYGPLLNQQQREMISLYLSGFSKSEAAVRAGYAQNNVSQAWQSAGVAAAMPAILDAFIQNEAAPAALRALYNVVSNDQESATARISAANSLLDRAGYTAKRMEVKEQSKDVSSMTRAELDAEIARLSDVIDSRTKDVTPTSKRGIQLDLDSEVIDIVEE